MTGKGYTQVVSGKASYDYSYSPSPCMFVFYICCSSFLAYLFVLLYFVSSFSLCVLNDYSKHVV